MLGMKLHTKNRNVLETLNTTPPTRKRSAHNIAFTTELTPEVHSIACAILTSSQPVCQCGMKFAQAATRLQAQWFAASAERPKPNSTITTTAMGQDMKLM